MVNDKTTRRYNMKFNFKAKSAAAKNYDGARAFKNEKHPKWSFMQQ